MGGYRRGYMYSPIVRPSYVSKEVSCERHGPDHLKLKYYNPEDGMVRQEKERNYRLIISFIYRREYVTGIFPFFISCDILYYKYADA